MQQQKLNVRHKTIGVAVAAALQVMVGGMSVANAACAPDPAVSGDNVVCTGTDTDGLKIGAGIDNLNITINSGAILQPNTLASPSVSLQVNAGNTIVNNGRIENVGGSQATNYLVNLNGANNTFTNNGEIFMGVSEGDIATTVAKNTRTLRGFFTSAPSGFTFDNLNIINHGSIVLENAGINNTQGFYPGEDIDGITIDNSGTIGVHRTKALTITVSGGNVFGNNLIAGTAAGALGVAAAIGSDDDAEMSVINRAGGIIEATGTYASAIFARAVELEIQNAGTIRSDAIAISAHGGLADGTHGELEIENLKSGQIIGDILAVDANALRYWAQEAKGLVGLNLNNQVGIRDSEIENEGTITGNIYLGSGSHEIENEGTISGNILVDQNTIGAPPGAAAARKFVLENEGTLNGNITIRDVAASINSITLEGDGFTGNISAANGVGANTLNLQGSGTLRGNVAKFSTLNVGVASGAPVDDDDDAGGSGWVLAAGKIFEFSNQANVNAGLLTVLGNLKANTNVNEGATLGGAGTITGNLVNNGTVDVANGILHIIGNTSFNDDSILKTTITPSSNGKLAVTGTASFDDDAILKPVVQNAVVKNGGTYTIVTSSGLTGAPQLQGSALIAWNVSSDPNNLIISANVLGASAAGVTGASSKALDALLGFDSELGIQIQNLETAEEVRKAGEQLRPETNGASMQAVLNVTDKVQGLVESHLDDTHLASITGKSGIATGNQTLGTGVWLQGFGFRGDQDKLDGVDGYTADAYGFAAGIDALLMGDKTRIGAAVSYAQSSVDDTGDRKGSRVDIDSYQATLYASWLLEGWYVNGSIGLGQHQFDNKKTILGNSVSGDHDAWQYSAKIDAGWPFKIGSATLVPVASLAYTRLNQDSYTEHGVGAQHVSTDNTDSVRSGLGAKAFLPLQEGNVNVALELRAIWNHEFGDRSLDTTVRYVDGGGAFTTQGLDLPRDSANLGASLKLSGISEAIQQSLLVSYDAEIKDQYLSHTARIQARFDF